MKTQLQHPFPALFDHNSKVLILGSFPSSKSRESNFFYGHPQNRFWKVIASIVGEETPCDIDSKKRLLYDNGIALWDSISQCEITGSSDSSIKNVVPNDLSPIFETAKIKQIFCNGKKSYELFNRYIQASCGITAICLPSTSPANASWSLERLISEYKKEICPYL